MAKVTMTDIVNGVAVASSSVTVEVTQGTVGPQGPKGDTGDTGATGATGPAGSDGADGVGVPAGGATGQVLAKASATDYDTAWVDQTGGTGSGTVTSVEGVSPDETGNVDLNLGTAAAAATSDFDPAGAAAAAQATAEGYTDTAVASEVTRADGAYATAAQGALADSAVQPAALGTAAALDVAAAGDAAVGEVVKGDDSRLTNSRTPTAHASTHAAAGSDPVTLAQSQVTNLTTDLAGKVPTTRTISAGTGLTGGGDLSANRSLAVSYGTAAGTAAQGNDSRLSDARTPTAHAASHAAAGTDAVALDASQVTRTTNAQTGTTYTLVLSDATKFISLTNAAAITLTVPPNASVAFPVGTEIILAQLGAGQVTIAPGSGVTLNSTPGLKIAAQYGTAALKKTATDTWLVFGRLAA